MDAAPIRTLVRLGLSVAVAGLLCVLITGAATAVTKKPPPLPAGLRPSPIAKMPCESEAQHELADALGLKGKVGPRTWRDHRYSCSYGYKTGSFTLSIQELSSWNQMFSYFRSFKRTMGFVRPLANLGQGAYQTADGSVVVRKDWKVLLVNVARLPDRFGVPQTAASDIAVTVAVVILGCWAGD
ncbi:MAG: hypothetical protein ACRDYB_02005 [Acidimicrobiales bacterium]